MMALLGEYLRLKKGQIKKTGFSNGWEFVLKRLVESWLPLLQKQPPWAGIPTSFRVAGKTQSLRVIMCNLGSNIQAETLRMELQQTEGNLDQVSMGEGIWKSGLVRGVYAG